MAESSFFLPSEVARLILGYIKDEGYMNTYKVFLKECSYLAEYVTLLKQGREFPLSVCGITLTMMLDDYARLKLLDTNLEAGHTNVALLWKQLECIVRALKLCDPDKKSKKLVPSAAQAVRMKRQISEARSPRKTFTDVNPPDSTARVAVHSCQRQATSPTPDCDTNCNSNSMDIIVDVTSVTDVTAVSNVTSLGDTTCVSNVVSNNNVTSSSNLTNSCMSLSVPNPDSREFSSEIVKQLLKKNSPNSKQNRSSSDLESQSHVNTELNSANTETSVADKQPSNGDSKKENDRRFVDSNSRLKENSETHIESNTGTKEKSVTKENKRVSQTEGSSVETEIVPTTSGDTAGMSDSKATLSPAKSQEPETSEVTNSNTCDSWYGGAPGVKGGDKLLEKFGIHQSSSSDSTDQEVEQHMQVPVTPSKSRPPEEMGLVTPVKQLQASEQSNKSPRRKKPKTPRKRLSDVDNKSSSSKQSKDPPTEQPTEEKLQQVIEPLLHDTRLHKKIAEISTVVLGKAHQNRSHNKSGDEQRELTAEELETITASQSLEEILETESFGHDLNLDLSDPVFEGLFRLFGTDKDAFHENLRREKHKTAVMEAEVEELEKSIHEEMVACGTLLSSQGDEGYETQRTQYTDDIYSSPKPSCSSQTGASEMSSPISQPHTPQEHNQCTSYTSSPRDRDKQNAGVGLTVNEPVNSPIHPSSPCLSQTDLFSPASHVTQPFSPALSEHSQILSRGPSTPSHSNTAAFSPAGDQTLEPESPYHQSMRSPVHMPSTPHVIHQNPPESPDEVIGMTGRRTPLPCSPLVKNDIQPGTPLMVQRYNTPFTPQSKHKAGMAAGTVRHLFSPQVYSPGTRHNAQVMIQTNLENGIPQYTQEVEVNATSETGTQTSTNQSINYTNFVSGVSSADNRSTPINVRAGSIFHGDTLTTIDNTIGCISLPPSQTAAEMPPPQGKGKGKKGGRGKDKNDKTTQKKAEVSTAKQGGFSTLIGLLSKPPQVSAVEIQKEDSGTALSMPVLTEQTDADTVVLNAAENDIHNDSISILSPGGENYIEVPILHCHDVQTEQHADIVSQAMSESNVTVDDETVCVWSQNLSTSTQLTIFSPQSAESNHNNGLGKELHSKGPKEKSENKKSTKKKLNLDSVSNDKAEESRKAVAENTNEEFVLGPGEVLIAEPLCSANPQKKVFMRSLNFGPNASSIRGSLMPSRKAAKNSALVPLKKKKSSELSTLSVNLTKDIRYKKIMPKPSGPIPVVVSVVPTTSKSSVATDETTVDTIYANNNLAQAKNAEDHYDSDTISYKGLSPIKSQKDCDKSPGQVNTKMKTDKPKKEKKQSKVSRPCKSPKECSENLKSVSPKRKGVCEKSKQGNTPHKRKNSKAISECDIKSNSGDKNNLAERDDRGKHNLNSEGGESVVDAECVKTTSKNDRKKINSKKGEHNTCKGDSESQKVESTEQKESANKSGSKETITKKGRKKNEKQLMKVKIVSSKAKSPAAEKQRKSSKNMKKVFMKSPVMQIRNKEKPTSLNQDSDSDEDIPLIVVKENLHIAEKKTGNLKVVDNTTECVEVSKTKEEINKEINKSVPDKIPRTPEKRTERSTTDTPSKEQVLEKLGLTPKKNAEDILQCMQSPSRNIIDLLVQLTPNSSEKSPRRRKKHQSNERPLNSPSQNRKTPAKRLFGSPNKIQNKNKKDSNIPSETRTEESASVTVSKAEKTGVDLNSENTSVKTSTEKAVKKVGKEKSISLSNTQKRSEKGSAVTRKGTLENLKKGEKKITPLKIKDLFKNTKIAVDRNKESRGGKKRAWDATDQEAENEMAKDKPSKKARNSLDLSVLDYEKMMAKLSKIHS